MRILYSFLILLFICSPSYAKRLDEMNANTSPDITNDLIYSQDVSDTSENSHGTGKSLTIKNLLKATKINVDGTNVGINTITPTQQLEVIGTVKATSFVGDGSALTGVSGSTSISDTAYGVGWDGDTTTGASKNALYDKIETLGSASISDAVYGSGWDGDTSTAPSKNAVYDKIETIGSTSGGWTDGGTNVSPTTSSDTVGIGTTLSSFGGSKFNVLNTSTPTGFWTPAAGFDFGTAADVAYIYPNDTDDVIWAFRGYAKQTGSATGSGHSIGVAGLAEDTSVGKQNIVAIEGRVEATGTADRYGGILGFVDAKNSSYTGKLYGVYTTFQGSHSGDSVAFYATPMTVGARKYAFYGSNDLVITEGNVGVGTYRPSANLELVQQSTTTPLMISSTATSDGDYLIVKSNGNVGINTINPVSSLNVVGTVNATSFVGDGSGLTGISGGGSIGIGTANTITFWPTTTTIGSLPTATYPSLTELSYVKGATSNLQTQIDGLSVGSGGWTDGGTNIYNTTTTDNVGIGTTIPSSSLMIKGSNTLGLKILNSATSGSTAGAGIQAISDDNTAMVQGDRLGFYVFGGSADTADAINLGAGISGYAEGTYSGSSAPSEIRFETAPSGSTTRSARVYVKSDGSVGIGTANPQSTLQVAGDSRIGNGSFSNTSANEDLYVEGNLEVDGTIYGSLSGNASTVTTNANLTGDVTSSGNTATIADSVTVTGWALGASTATTPSGGDNDTSLATTAYVQTELSGLGSGGWTDGGTKIYPTLTSDQVAIGTTTPVGTNALTVRGTIGGSGTGPIVLSDANVGIGTTTAPALLTVGSTGSFQIDTSGNTRVGIGTTTAGTIICVKSISSGTAVLGYCTGSLTNSICATCN